MKVAYTIVYVGLFGAVFMGILLHADQFKTAFGSVSSFFLNEMNKLEGK